MLMKTPLALLLLAVLPPLAAAVPAAAESPYVRRFPAGSSSLQLVLRDQLKFPAYRWPRTLLSYIIDFSAAPVAREQLVLLDTASGTPAAFQLTDVRTEGGRIRSARVAFFADLPSGGERFYELRVDGRRPGAPILPAAGVKVTRTEQMIEIDGGALRVRLPGSRTLRAGETVPGPIAGLRRGGAWLGSSRLLSPGRAVERLETTCVEQGDLFVTHRLHYVFAGGASYTAHIKVVHGYDFFEFEESMLGLAAGEAVAVEMAWTGFKPTRRFGAMHREGRMGEEKPGWPGIADPVVAPYVEEDPHWGPGWREDPAVEMVWKLAPYGGNGVRELPPHMAFWNDAPSGEELGVFVLNHEKWQDHQYTVWQHSPLLQVRFRHNAREGLVWTWPLVTGTRSTAINLHDVAAGEAEVEALRADYLAVEKRGARGDRRFDAAEMRLRYNQLLHARHGFLSLDKVKDWILEYPAGGQRPQEMPGAGKVKTAAEFEEQLFRESFIYYPLGVNTWPGVNSIQHRFVYEWVTDGYTRLQAGFSPEQRRRVEALLLLAGYVTSSEEMHPIRTALAGCPNMAADGWCVPMQMALLFPEHPLAGEWRDYYELTMRLSSRLFTRPEVPAYESRGGRWTESLATYHWAHLRPTSASLLAGLLADGKNRWANPSMADRGRWLVDMLSAPIYNPNPLWRQDYRRRKGEAPIPPAGWKPGDLLDPAKGFIRQYPAHGAHGSGTTLMPPPLVRLIGHSLLRYEPLTAEHLLWLGTDKEQFEGRHGSWPQVQENLFDGNNPGTPPDLRSCKYTGHGLVFRAGVGSPEELSLHLDQIDQGPNYRWGNAGEGASGSLYFFARGRFYNGHERESAGDRNLDDTDGVTTFGVMKDGEYRAIGMNLLERPLYDLGVAQFGELVPRSGPGAYSWPEYCSRSALLVGTDYFILSDHTIGGPGRFSWFTARDQELPQLIFLQPASIRPDHWTELRTATSKGFHRDVQGSHRVLVSHRDDVSVEGWVAEDLPFLENPRLKDYRVRSRLPEGVYQVRTPTSRDLVFREENGVEYREKETSFAGAAGVIRWRKDGTLELAMMHSRRIGADGVTLEVDQPELGVSLVSTGLPEARGQLFSRAGGKLRLGFAGAATGAAKQTVFHLDGEPVRVVWSGEQMEVAIPAGAHRWELTGTRPTPMQPEVLRTENISAGATVFWSAVAGAEQYRLETSRDGARTWATATLVPARATSAALTGLPNSTKVHLRVTAESGERRSTPSSAYPLYVSDQPPLPPDGLALQPGRGTVSAAWGQVLGVQAYRLQRRPAGTDRWQQVYQGAERRFDDATATGVVPPSPLPGLAANALHDVSGVTIYEYAVAAVNANGEGARSHPVSTDPRSWLVWRPDTPDLTFRRRTAYWQEPYVPAAQVPPLFYPAARAEVVARPDPARDHE